MLCSLPPNKESQQENVGWAHPAHVPVQAAGAKLWKVNSGEAHLRSSSLSRLRFSLCSKLLTSLSSFSHLVALPLLAYLPTCFVARFLGLLLGRLFAHWSGMPASSPLVCTPWLPVQHYI